MLKMSCDRCGRFLGPIKKGDGNPPDGASRFEAPLFSEYKKRLVHNAAPMDLCERCARELVELLAGWCPGIEHLQRQLFDLQTGIEPEAKVGQVT